MKLKTEELKKVIKNSEKISKGIDYLRLNIQDVKSDIIRINKQLSKMIDYDNSNFIIFDEFGYELTAQKINLSNGRGLIYSYSFFNTVIPIFCIIEYSYEHKSLFNSWGKIDFYGSFFRLCELGEFVLQDFFGFIIQDMEITRIDYRIDFINSNYQNIDKNIVQTRKNTFEQTYKTGGEITSWRFGQKQNKTVVVRGYNKKLDTDKKGKWKLYSDYMEFDRVFRIEYEFLNTFCKGYTIGSLNKLEQKCLTYIGLENYYDGKYYQAYNKLDLTNDFAKVKYCKMMSAYIREALKNGINVYKFVDIEMNHLYGIDEKELENIRKNNKVFSEYINNKY